MRTIHQIIHIILYLVWGKQGEWGYMFSLKRTYYTIIYTMEEQG